MGIQLKQGLATELVFPRLTICISVYFSQLDLRADCGFAETGSEDRC
jgi:hypothetical protein